MAFSDARNDRDRAAGGSRMGRDSRNSYGENRMGRLTGGIASLARAPMPRPMGNQMMQRPTGPQPPYLMQSQVPAATLGGPIPGLGNYQLNLPSYGYFGLPGQQRPPMGQSAILNPMRPRY